MHAIDLLDALQAAPGKQSTDLLVALQAHHTCMQLMFWLPCRPTLHIPNCLRVALQAHLARTHRPKGQQ